MGESLGETLFGDWVWDVLGSFVLALRAAALGVLAVVAILVLAVLVLGVLSVVGVLVVLALGDFLGGGFFTADLALFSRSSICFWIRREESWMKFRVLVVSAEMSSR